MLTYVASIICVILITLAVRHRYRDLPLHYDTGYYVSNSTIVHRRWSFRNGWNARYAGCSKALPEWIYSWAYLRATSNPENDVSPGVPYSRLSRAIVTGYCLCSALAVGALAYVTVGGMEIPILVGALFLLVVSEPQYGVYQECAEVFELLPIAMAMTCIFMGVYGGDPYAVGIGAAIWLLDAFFVKLSSAVSFVVVTVWVNVKEPTCAGPWLIGSAIAVALFGTWCFKQGRSPVAMLRSLWGHERTFAHGLSIRLLLHRLWEKATCLWRIAVRQPVVPALALLGMVVAGGQAGLLWVALVALLLAMFAQASDTRYYAIPLLPMLAIFAGIGAHWLVEMGWAGWIILTAMGAFWMWRNFLAPWRMSASELNRWCWEGFRPEWEVQRNYDLEVYAHRFREQIGARSVLVYGPLNQAYVLIGSSYDIQLIAPADYMDDLQPGWQRELNQRLIVDPPGFVLDTGRCFAAEGARHGLGLDYRCVETFGDWLRLYELVQRGKAVNDVGNVQTFAPQSDLQWAAEEARGSRSNITQPARFDGPTNNGVVDAAASALRELLGTLADRGHRRVAVYGAGRFTTRYADIYRASPIPVSIILDDQPARHGREFLDWPITSLESADRRLFDAVIISTDRFQNPMKERVARRWQGDIPAYSI